MFGLFLNTLIQNVIFFSLDNVFQKPELDKPGTPVTMIRATPGKTSAVTPADRGWKKVKDQRRRKMDKIISLNLRIGGALHGYKIVCCLSMFSFLQLLGFHLCH